MLETQRLSQLRREKEHDFIFMSLLFVKVILKLGPVIKYVTRF